MEVFLGLGVAAFIIFAVFRERRRRKQDADTHRTISAIDATFKGSAPSVQRTSDPKPQTQRPSEPVGPKTVLIGPAWVTDGDTIKIKKREIRLFGIDAPEMNHPYGKKAKWALHGLCKGHQIRAEITDEDAHGRAVAKCFLPDGRDLSAEMVKLGLAIDWPKFSGGAYAALETADARKKLFLADARQKGRMHVWEKYEAKKASS